MKAIFNFMMDSFALRLILLAILFVRGVNVYSQSCDSSQSCCCDVSDLNPSGIMLGHMHPKGKWMVSYRYMNMFQAGNLSGTSQVTDDAIFNKYIMSPASMNMEMHMLMAMYGITGRLSVMAMFNYNIQSMNMNMLPGTMHMHMDGMTMPDMSSTNMVSKTAGLGDTKLYGIYSLIDHLVHKVILSAGLNLPTGNITLNGNSKNAMYSGLRLPYMMQLGSGTWDILPGVTYLYRKPSFLIGVQLSGVIRPGYNPLGYSYGNAGTGSMWAAFKLLPWLSASLRAEGVVTDRIYGRDPNLYEVMEPDAAPQNYGGQIISGYGGLNFYFKKLSNSRLSVEYGMPFYQKLNGPQLATRNMLYAGWTVSF
ncbi:MAG: transporter [Bacteroidia bacterium]